MDRISNDTVKALIIIPYYGKLPSYFYPWIISASNQRNIDFLMVTDLLNDKKVRKYRNIKILNISFEQLKGLIQSKFEFQISMERPYKLCDYRPAYGYIFEEYLNGYDYWGHCDIDVVFGDLYKFIGKSMEEAYDCIGKWGHLSLYKNSKEINTLFMKSGALFSYKEVFADDCTYAFDETTGIKSIIRTLPELKVSDEFPLMADIRMAHSDFMGDGDFKNFPEQIFIYEKGLLLQCYKIAETLKYREVMYLHFQKKKPKCLHKLCDSFYIMHDRFVPRKNSSLDESVIDAGSMYRNKLFKLFEVAVFHCNKILAFFKYNRKQKIVTLKKRIFISKLKVNKC